MPYVYILHCSNDSFYVGATNNLETRTAQHEDGTYKGYTSIRLPVKLVWSQEVATDNDASLLERKLKGWSRAKKTALIRGDIPGIHEIVKQERQRREGAKKDKG